MMIIIRKSFSSSPTTAIIITIMEESTRTAPNRTESTLPSFRFRYRVIERKLFLFDKRIQSCVYAIDEKQSMSEQRQQQIRENNLIC